MKNILRATLASAALILSVSTISPVFAACDATTNNASEGGFLQTCSREPDEVIITGAMTLKEIETSLPSYSAQFQDYNADKAAIKQLQQISTPTQVVVAFGTWCPDSQRETPRFMKLLKQVNNPNITVKFIAVDHDLKDPKGLAAPYKIDNVPTFIVQQQQKTLGTIIEKPTVSLEKDLLNILAK
ncbi:TlpA family protein disulfide reductase [Shewanella intestini]|uniref:Thioredoxin family protein n=1 Tax=Shewanella intestini TaxID=2017544 RepID=A0ABS5I0H6_9GAMM|nr:MULTISPECIES: thioredoxin family protein [Shewanella]MBR9727526.1 thioredoxin family protein [Shewanella intestini]MRG35324.1 thioredoxin [Shewanella sp. XMDDZSB0408]